MVSIHSIRYLDQQGNTLLCLLVSVYCIFRPAREFSNTSFLGSIHLSLHGPSWSYDSWIYNYLCNQCLTPLTLWVRTPLRRGDRVFQWLTADRCSSPGTTVSSTNKTECHDITEILLKVALSTITFTLTCYFISIFRPAREFIAMCHNFHSSICFSPMFHGQPFNYMNIFRSLFER